MPAPKLSKELAEQAVNTLRTVLSEGVRPPGTTGHGFGAMEIGARRLNMSCRGFNHRLNIAKELYGLDWKTEQPPYNPERQFTIPPLPDPDPPATELLEYRESVFNRKFDAHKARKLIPIQVNCDGPVGIIHFGDPHIDDDGCDVPSLRRDVALVNKTDGMFAANLGDLSNNWVGRLARLYGEQSTSARQGWKLVEWLVGSVPWLYIVGGNHDCWSGAGDPIKWMTASAGTVYEAWGARVALRFPNGKSVRVNARHDFSGHSMWNPNHGPMKATMGGWRDHILTCGHKHISFITGPLKDPATGLLSWAIRCAGYKVIDGYATEKGLPDQNSFPSAVTIIDPTKGDDDPNLICVFAGTEEACDFLEFKRKKAGVWKRGAGTHEAH